MQGNNPKPKRIHETGLIPDDKEIAKVNYKGWL